MSGHRPFSEIRRGPPGSWNRIAGDDRDLHYFADTTAVGWWWKAECGKGPAVGKSDTDGMLDFCRACSPVEDEEEATT